MDALKVLYKAYLYTRDRMLGVQIQKGVILRAKKF